MVSTCAAQVRIRAAVLWAHRAITLPAKCSLTGRLLQTSPWDARWRARVRMKSQNLRHMLPAISYCLPHMLLLVNYTSRPTDKETMPWLCEVVTGLRNVMPAMTTGSRAGTGFRGMQSS